MDPEKLKKTIYISLGISATLIVGFFAYQYLYPKTTTTPTGETSVTGRFPALPETGNGAEKEKNNSLGLKPGEELPLNDEQKLYRITDFPVVSPSLNKDESKIFFYKKVGGDLLSSDFTGKSQEKVSNITVVGIIGAIWSPLRDRAAVFYLDGETLKGFLHQTATGSVAVLPQNIKSFSWSPDGKSVAYLLRDGDNLKLVTADSLNRTPKTIFRTPILDSIIKWITSDKVIFSQTPSGLAEGFIFQFSRSSGAFSKALGPLHGLTGLWSPDGARALISYTNYRGKNLLLSLRNNSGKEIMPSPGATMADKCFFASAKEIYCALPSFIDPVWMMPDDYYRGQTSTFDSVVYVDAEKGGVSSVLPTTGFDITNLMVTKNKSWLVFVSRADGTLWAVKLK